MKLALVLLFSFVLFSSADYPGVKLRVHENIINQGYTHYAGMITDFLKGQEVDLKDISITKSALFFKISLTFHTLLINQIDLTAGESVVVDLQPDNTVTFKINQIPFDLQIAYNLKYIFDDDLETLDVKAMISQLLVSAKIVKDEQGCLSVQLNTFTGQIDNFSYDLKAHDLIVKAINFLGEWAFKRLIQQAINQSWDKIQVSLQTQINQLTETLKQYYTLQVPNTQFVVDLHFIELSTEINQLDVEVNGTIFDTKQPVKLPPFSPNPMVDLQTDFPMTLQLSDYTTNDLLYTLYDLGYLSLDITSDMMPSSSPLKLDTDSLNLYFPGLFDTFGSQNVSTHCVINDTPKTHFQFTNMTGQFKSACDWYVNSTNGFVHAFTMQTTIDLNLNVTVRTNDTGTFVKLYIGGLSFSTWDYSNIHEGLNLNPTISKMQFNILANFGVQIYNGMNLWIKVPLPDYFLIQDSGLIFQDGSIELGFLPKWYIEMLRAAWSS